MMRVLIMATLVFLVGAKAPQKKPRETKEPQKEQPKEQLKAQAAAPKQVGSASQPVFDAEETPCAACHKSDDWKHVSFAHDRTGFALRGKHAQLACADCHQRGFDDANAAIASACSSCHRDPHAGSLGAHCESCHDDQSFRSSFTADAHRRSNFPLVGKHAVIPCEQCHGPMRERIFSRAPSRCVDCHQADYDGTSATSIDHASAGFSLECRQCHGVWRFSPAQFVAHDSCFQLAGTAHGGISCRQCHASLAGASVSGQCTTGTAACSACHTHDCSRTDAQHTGVPGYQCKDRKCYECHRFSR